MAKLTLNTLMAALRGSVGDLVVVRDGESLYVRRRGKKPKGQTSRQSTHCKQFAQATSWALRQIADPLQKAAYKRACHGHLTPYNMAVRDFMTPPSVHSVLTESYTGKIGDVVRIVAADDFGVVRVSVSIRAPAGGLIEEGDAVRVPEAVKDGALRPELAVSMWKYTARKRVDAGTTVEFEVEAFDGPGNRASKNYFFYIG